MEPLSIVAGSAGIATLCVKVSISLHAFVEDYKTVDRNTADLLDEIKSLTRVAEAIYQSWQPSILKAVTTHAGDVWKSVQDTLQDCQTTLEKLAKALQDVGKGRAYFPRKVMRTLRLNLKMKDIMLYKQQFQTYNSGMQSALQMINVCLLVNGNSSQDSIKQGLESLKAQIGRIEANIHQPPRPDIQLTPAEVMENEKLARNLSQLVRTANDFHSSASTVIEGDRSTVWGGSVMGEPLGTEQYAHIHGWIPPVVFEDDETGIEAYDNLGLIASKGPLDSDTDSGSDAERDLIMDHFQDIVTIAFNNQDWEKAEKYLRKIVSQEKSKSRPRAMPMIELMLACSCMFLSKWEEGEAIVLPYTTGKTQHNILLYYGLYGLANFKCHQEELPVALKYCQQAVRGIRKAEGRDAISYQVSLRFLAYIHGAMGNGDIEDGFLSHVREEHLSPVGEDPVLALVKIMKSFPDGAAANKQSPDGPSGLNDSGSSKAFGVSRVLRGNDSETTARPSLSDKDPFYTPRYSKTSSENSSSPTSPNPRRTSSPATRRSLSPDPRLSRPPKLRFGPSSRRTNPEQRSDDTNRMLEQSERETTDTLLQKPGQPFEHPAQHNGTVTPSTPSRYQEPRKPLKSRTSGEKADTPHARSLASDKISVSSPMPDTGYNDQNLIYGPKTRSFLPTVEVHAMQQRLYNPANKPVKAKKMTPPVNNTGLHSSDLGQYEENQRTIGRGSTKNDALDHEGILASPPRVDTLEAELREQREPVKAEKKIVKAGCACASCQSFFAPALEIVECPCDSCRSLASSSGHFPETREHSNRSGHSDSGKRLHSPQQHPPVSPLGNGPWTTEPNLAKDVPAERKHLHSQEYDVDIGGRRIQYSDREADVSEWSRNQKDRNQQSANSDNQRIYSKEYPEATAEPQVGNKISSLEATMRDLQHEYKQITQEIVYYMTPHEEAQSSKDPVEYLKILKRHEVEIEGEMNELHSMLQRANLKSNKENFQANQTSDQKQAEIATGSLKEGVDTQSTQHMKPTYSIPPDGIAVTIPTRRRVDGKSSVRVKVQRPGKNGSRNHIVQVAGTKTTREPSYTKRILLEPHEERGDGNSLIPSTQQVRKDSRAFSPNVEAFLRHSRPSAINNPELLEKVEDTIKRLILPELDAIKREKMVESMRAAREKESLHPTTANNYRDDDAYSSSPNPPFQPEGFQVQNDSIVANDGKKSYRKPFTVKKRIDRDFLTDEDAAVGDNYFLYPRTVIPKPTEQINRESLEQLDADGDFLFPSKQRIQQEGESTPRYHSRGSRSRSRDRIVIKKVLDQDDHLRVKYPLRRTRNRHRVVTKKDEMFGTVRIT